MLRRVALVRTDVSEERSASFIRMTHLVALLKEALIPPKRRFLQEPQGVISQKTPFCKKWLASVQKTEINDRRDPLH
jgi:hypothetical protein